VAILESSFPQKSVKAFLSQLLAVNLMAHKTSNKEK